MRRDSGLARTDAKAVSLAGNESNGRVLRETGKVGSILGDVDGGAIWHRLGAGAAGGGIRSPSQA